VFSKEDAKSANTEPDYVIKLVDKRCMHTYHKKGLNVPVLPAARPEDLVVII
jgi:hypothetical protein